MREKIAAANWKMNLNTLSIKDFIKDFPPLIKESNVKNIFFPPYIYLFMFQNQDLLYGAQNVHNEERGAFTGEISCDMLRDLGCRYAIIGHSERRHVFGECDVTVNKKLKAVIKSKMTPIFCIGELLEERKAGKTFDVLKKQLKEGLAGIDDIAEIIIAYEPVWAIGTGETATPEIAQETHLFIRDLLFGIKKDGGNDMTILYGGSVKPENTKELIKMPDIDGFLVGGASINPESFAQITMNMEA